MSVPADSLDLTSQTYHQLRQLIISGGIPPGSVISESDVAARLRISRTPVRSALHRLRQEGWITSSGTEKRIRLTVSPLTREDAVELFDLLGALEGMAARRAASLPGPERYRLLRDLRARGWPSGQEVPARDPTEPGLVDAVRAPRLRAMYHAIRPQVERYRGLHGAVAGKGAGATAPEYDAALRAIEGGDAVAAETAVRSRWAEAAGRVVQVIDSWGEKGRW